jgi:hypothetical protein
MRTVRLSLFCKRRTIFLFLLHLKKVARRGPQFKPETLLFCKRKELEATVAFLLKCGVKPGVPLYRTSLEETVARKRGSYDSSAALYDPNEDCADDPSWQRCCWYAPMYVSAAEILIQSLPQRDESGAIIPRSSFYSSVVLYDPDADCADDPGWQRCCWLGAVHVEAACLYALAVPDRDKRDELRARALQRCLAQ